MLDDLVSTSADHFGTMSGMDKRWIEAESMKKEDDEDDEGFDSLFQDPDPFDTFIFDWQFRQRDIHLELKGHKQELGQTLNSTGLTLWRASNILCDFMLQRAEEFVEGKTILEVSVLTCATSGHISYQWCHSQNSL